jgi:CheY-like chemotaxis protein
MKKIYIVDDDKDIVDSITMVLESNGYTIGHQLNNENVVDNIRGFGPDLVILDVIFPGNPSAGFDMARDIREEDDLKALPILMLSAINEKGPYAGTFSNRDRDESFLPVNDFVEKPITPDQLLDKVKSLTEG